MKIMKWKHMINWELYIIIQEITNFLDSCMKNSRRESENQKALSYERFELRNG